MQTGNFLVRLLAACQPPLSPLAGTMSTQAHGGLSSLAVNQWRLPRCCPMQDLVSEQLEAGIEVRIYVGVEDWICNWVGNKYAALLQSTCYEYSQTTLAMRPLMTYL